MTRHLLLHDTRTPVSVLLTHAQNGLRADGLTAEHRKAFEAIERGAQRMRQMVEALLQLSRLEAGSEDMRFAPHDLAHLVRECLDLLQPIIITNRIELETDLASTPCVCDGDLIHQACMNLLTNAVQHNRVGGMVSVQLSATATEAIIAITNTGPEIAASDQPRLFDRFYRADLSRSGGSSGLGLAITKAITESHHGNISVSSCSNATTFTLVLPLHPPPR